MVFRYAAAILCTCALLAPVDAEAQKRLGAGPYFNTRYRMVSTGSTSTTAVDGKVTVTTDEIETINCSGCDVVEYYPGTLFNVRNNTRRPLCFAYYLKPKAGSFNGVTTWGGGTVFLLKPRQSIAKFAGITMNFGRRRANLGYGGYFRSWDPIDKKRCGPDPYES